MHWQKYGCLWAPAGEADWATTHATLPVVQPLGGDRWWVYVSTRDAQGKSRIGRLTVDVGPLAQSELPRVEDFDAAPVLTLGAAGTFDDSGVMPSWLVDDGDVLRMYYIGWNVIATVPYRVSIGLAVSRDGGRTFDRVSAGPVFDRCAEEPYFVTTPCVLYDEGAWRMWYTSATGWRQIDGKWEPSYHVKYAESNDGVKWTATGVSAIDMGPDVAVCRPAVFCRGGRYAMFYSYRCIDDYRTVPEQAYRLGYAESADGVHWERMDDQVGIERSTSGWDSEMIEYSWLQRHAGQTYLLYNGNGFGRSGVGIARLVSLAARA